MPDARNARVGLQLVELDDPVGEHPARPDSDWPHVRALRITKSSPLRALRSGSTVPSTISRISHGTPGTA